MTEPIFPKNEFQERYHRARQLMTQAGLQALLAYSPGNQFWLTGFRGSSGIGRIADYTHQLLFPKVVLPLNGEPALTGIGTLADSYARETHIKDIRPVAAPIAQRPRMIKEILDSRGIHSGRIGVDLRALGAISPGELDLLRQELSGYELVDAEGIFWRLRMIKSAAEIACLRRAVEIQDQSYSKFVKRISRNMTETQLLFEMVRCQGESGATDFGMILTTTHPTSTFWGAQESDRPLNSGGLQWFDAGSTYKGYTSDYDILIAWDEPSREQKQVHSLLREVYEEALASWLPGRPVAEIARETAAVMAKHGVVDPLEGTFMGHNLGYDVVERPWFGVRAPKDLYLQPGMVISPEWISKTSLGQFLWEDNFLVTDTGLEKLSRFSRELHVIAN